MHVEYDLEIQLELWRTQETWLISGGCRDRRVEAKDRLFKLISVEITLVEFCELSNYQQRNLGYPRYKIQFAKHMKLKKNEDQSLDALPLLRTGNKTSMEGVTETKFGAETKGWTIKRLPYSGIHPIISFQTLTPLHTVARFCRKDPDIAVSCETMPGPNKHRSGCSQSTIGWITGPPMEELEKVPKELKGTATL